MRMIDQKILDHCPAEGRFGDCFRASMATLLGMELEDVPHFMAYDPDGPDALVELAPGIQCDRWYRDARHYLEARGIGIISYDLDQIRNDGMDVMAFLRSYDVFYEIDVPSPRFENTKHSVIARAGKIVHDPHPSRAGGDLSKASLMLILTVGGLR